MFDLGQSITSTLTPLGEAGLLLTIFALFYIDAIIFPTLPELFTVIVFMVTPTTSFAVLILVTIAIAEFSGFCTLYFLVRYVRVPKVVQNAVSRYCKFLVVKDEKVILFNRIAPMVPFIGAFAAIMKWDFRRCILYTFVGGVAKYGAILALSNLFYVYLSSGLASTVTLILIAIVIAASFVLSLARRKKAPDRCDVDPKGPGPAN